MHAYEIPGPHPLLRRRCVCLVFRVDKITVRNLRRTIQQGGPKKSVPICAIVVTETIQRKTVELSLNILRSLETMLCMHIINVVLDRL